MVYGNLEARIFLSRYKLLIPGKFGIVAFSDLGRVFLDGENSTMWHNTYGGGIWFSAVYDEQIVRLYLAKSKEKMAYYLSFGFMY